MRVDYSKDYSNEYIVENGRYYGTYYFQNVVYEGNWIHTPEGEKFHGEGTLTYNDGSTFNGHFSYGKKDGFGVLNDKEGVYSGLWKNGKRDGYGTQQYKSGALYIGNWKEDKLDGKGFLIYPDQSTYEGGFKNGKKCGYGEFRFKNGESYMGEFKDGLKHGYGIFTYLDGSTYTGNWYENKRQGFGTLTRGEVEEKGIWDEDVCKREGRASFILPNGDVYIVEIRNGQLNGKGTINYHTGESMEASFLNNELNGHCTYYKEGLIFSGQFVGGKPDGKMLINYTNGDACKQVWENGKPKSSVEFYFANGDTFLGTMNLETKEKLNGIFTQKGVGIYRGEFANNVPNGKGVFSFQNGVRHMGEFKDGKLQKGYEERPNGEVYKAIRKFGKLFYKKDKTKNFELFY